MSNTFLNLPNPALNLLSGGLTFLMACTGIRVVRASNLAVSVANARLVTSSSADKLELQAQKLQEQADIIERKSIAYDQLEETYRAYQNQQVGNVDLEDAFEVVQQLPEIEDIEEIENEIQETESELSEVTE